MMVLMSIALYFLPEGKAPKSRKIKVGMDTTTVDPTNMMINQSTVTATQRLSSSLSRRVDASTRSPDYTIEEKKKKWGV